MICILNGHVGSRMHTLAVEHESLTESLGAQMIVSSRRSEPESQPEPNLNVISASITLVNVTATQFNEPKVKREFLKAISGKIDVPLSNVTISSVGGVAVAEPWDKAP